MKEYIASKYMYIYLRVDYTTKVRCKICSVGFGNHADMRCHRRLVHYNQSSGEIKKEDLWYSCSWCTRLSGSRRQAAAHYKSHNRDLGFTCTYCKRKFKKLWMMIRHRLVHSVDRKDVKIEDTSNE